MYKWSPNRRRLNKGLGCFFLLKGMPISFLQIQECISKKYKNLLKYQPAIYSELLDGENYIFLQDNALIHTLHITEKWLSEQRVNVVPWPSHSPDINPIETL